MLDLMWDLGTDFMDREQIPLSEWYESMLAISETGEIYCYLGCIVPESYGGSMYPVCSAQRRGIDRAPDRFVRLVQGMPLQASFLKQTGGKRDKVKILSDLYAAFPAGPKSYFGVVSRKEGEQLSLTREVFGATEKDISNVLYAFASVVDRVPHPFDRYPRITFSKSQDNSCDLTGTFIPRLFPYVAFEESGYFRSHVSLYGFYRLVAFHCGGCTHQNPNRFYSRLIEAGADSESLDTVIQAGTNFRSSMLRWPLSIAS
ncbi:MAG: hypothetical protein KAZ26_05910 [Caldilineaceae bacterium]|nr:hypothetical protein [Caldilineaceae bacterium]